MSDYPPSEIVIEGQIIKSDLKEIHLTDAEKCESACFDALASNTEQLDDDPRPMGKRVY